jgi:RND family efflux transporter MFP subunit
MMKRPLLIAAAVPVIALAMTGCARKPAEVAPATVSVKVSRPVEREVSDHTEFTGRTAAVDSVDVKAHVWGYLEKVNFKEGALVKKGDVLFELDFRPYEAVLNQAKAKVVQDEAQLSFDEAEYNRNVAAGRAVSRSDLEKSLAARNVDSANIAADKSTVASRQLDFDYTKVRAPITGRTSNYRVTTGNLVQSGDQSGGTLLTTIVSTDPMYAYFDVDEQSAPAVRKLVVKPDGSADENCSVALVLANEEGYPHKGTINFVDNQINPKTGTIRVRGVFPNKDESLLPGLFARVRVPLGPPHKALLVNEHALDSDQGQHILYVVNDENEVIARRVKLGAMHDGLREITEGVKSGDRIIVSGVQQVRPGVVVEATLVDMP